MRDPDFTATDDCSVVLHYLPEVPIWVVQGDERNMKVTEPIDVYLADKLFQLTSQDVPAPATDEEYRAALAGKTMVVFGGSYGIGGDIADLARSLRRRRPRVQPVQHQHPRRATRRHRPRRRRRSWRRPAGSTSSSTPPACCPARPLLETSEETIYAATDVNYLAPIFIAQEFHPHLKETRGSLLLFTSSSYTRGRGGYSLYSSAKAAVVNLTQALADEWAGDGRAGQLRQPRADRDAHAHQGVRRGAQRPRCSTRCRWRARPSTC